MIDALLARAAARFVFVVGKGGVGKTTTAGGIALAFADDGAATHLISTDPAHSLLDLFHHQDCSSNLVLEEFDARSYADRLFAELRTPLTELIERGTYLDSKDAAGFLDLSIPGIDEVMSVLRLVDLHESGVQKIVVDTAPTGHTIRLLDSGATIESWVHAGRAMAEKAGVVAAALVGRGVRFDAEPLLDDLQRKVERFTDEVLANACALVITRPGSVVNAETVRLIEYLEERHVKIAALISVTGTTADAQFTVEDFRNESGCAGVRAWRAHVVASQETQAETAHTVTAQPVRSAESWIRSLHEPLIWVAGKGGVGKSTCAAAIALSLSETRRVKLVSTDPAGSLPEILGNDAGSLQYQQIDAVTEFNRMRAEYQSAIGEVFSSLGLDNSAQLDRRVVEALWDFAPPGIDEIISLIEILDQAPNYDCLVIDSAPTGHFLRLLQMPELALDWVHALLRLLVKYGATASLDALAQRLLAFAKQLRQTKLDLSTSGTTAVFVVTLAEAMVQAETARLSSTLEQAGVPVAATIVNRADDGEAGDRPRWIHAPDFHHEIVGPAMLRSFIAQWSLGE